MILFIKKNACGGPRSFSQDRDIGLNVKLLTLRFNVEQL